MILGLFLLFSFAVLLLFIKDVFEDSFKYVVLSHFWIFTIYYYITYFLSIVFIYFDSSILDSFRSPKLNEMYLIQTLIIAIFAWILVYFGYKINFKKKILPNISIKIDPKRLIILSLFGIVVFYFVHYDNIFNYFFNQIRIDIFAFSDGNGLIVKLSGIFRFAFIFYLVFYFSSLKTSSVYVSKWHLIVLFILVITLIISSFLLYARKDLGIILFVFLYLMALLSDKKHSFFVYVLLFFLLIIPFSSTFLQIVRDKNDFTDIIMISKQVKYRTVQSFEGHWMALYLQKTDIQTILFGMNHLEMIENFLKFIPRFIWENKPYDLGIYGLQAYLAPQSFAEIGRPKITMPSTILVEIVYAYGVILGTFFMFGAGVFFRFLSDIFTKHKMNDVLMFLSVYIYLYMFIFVRSGGSFLTTLIFPLIFLFFIVKRDKKNINC